MKTLAQVAMVAVFFIPGLAITAENKKEVGTAELLMNAEVQTQMANLCYVNQQVVQMNSQAACDAAMKREADEAEAKKAQVENAVKNKRRGWKRHLEDIEGGASLKLVDLDLLDGVSFGLKYKFKVENNRRRDVKDKYFTRLDKWRMKARINAGTILDGDDSPILFGIDDEAEITFAQHFNTVGEAYSPKNAYMPHRLPISADKAIGKLKAGDYARFDATMNLMAGATQMWPTGAFEVGGSAYYVLSGNYEVHVYRLANEQVRIKLIGDRRNGFRLALEAGLDTGGLGTIKRRLTRLSNLDDAVELRWSKIKSDLMLLDYTLDLKQESAREAYDALFNNAKQLHTNIDIIREDDPAALRKKLIASAIELEDLALECNMLKAEEAHRCAVKRNYKASNRSRSRNRSIEFDIKLAKYEAGSVYRKNFLTQVTNDVNTGEEVTKHYLFPTLTIMREKGFLFKKWHKEVVRTANAIFTADAQERPDDFKNLGFSLRHKEKTFLKGEQEALLAYVKSLLSADQFEKLRADLAASNDWKSTEKEIKSFDVMLEYYLHREALGALMAAGYGDRENLKEAIKDYLVHLWESGNKEAILAKANAGRHGSHRGNQKRNEAYFETQDENGRVVTHRGRLAQTYRGSIRSISKQLARAIGTMPEGPLNDEARRQANEQRLSAFLKLRKSSTFRRFGSGLIMFIVKKAAAASTQYDYDDLVHFSLDMRARRKAPFKFEVGSNRERELYDLVRFIEAVLNDRDDDALEYGNLADSTDNQQLFEDAQNVETIMQNQHVVITN